MKTLSYVALFICFFSACSQELKDSELNVVRTTHTSAGGEISKAFTAAVVGFFLVLLAFPLLWTNERREAKMWALFGGARSIVKQNVSSGSVDSANEARLVHMVGTLSSKQELVDSLFGIKVSNCAKLLREVQMFQWIETEQTEERDTMMGGKEKVTTYSYSMDWRSYPVSSSHFQESGHNNPPFPCESQEVKAKQVNFGAFVLTDRLVDKLYTTQSLKGAELPEKLSAFGVPPLRLVGEHYTSETGSPNIGDLRISFLKVPCGDAAILAVQHDNSFAPLTVTMNVQNGRVIWPEGMNASLLDPSSAKDIDLSRLEDGGCCAICSLVGEVVESNEEIYEIAEKKANALEMLQAAQNKQELIHIVLQIVGFLLLFIGFDAMFSFVPTLFRIIPFIGTWIQFFGNMIAHVLAFVLAGFLWCITVALAWLAMRPMKAVLLLGVAALLIAIPTYLSASSSIQPVPHY